MTSKADKNDASVLIKLRKMKKRKRFIINIILVIVGLIFISLGTFLQFEFETLYEMLLKSALKFENGSKAYTAWLKNDPPLPMDIYVFNWTNPQDIDNSSVKPKLQELGPYKFKECKEKVDIQWHDNNTISYRHRKFYYYDDDKSGRNLSDVVNIINAVPLTLAYRNRFTSGWAKSIMSVGMRVASSIYVTKTVGQILFEGFDENIMTVASSIPFVDVTDKFGYFYGRNGTVGLDGVFSMWTANDEKFGSIQSWNYGNHTDYYGGSCSDIKGSTGEFHPLNRERDAVYIYSPELCKYARLTYEEDVEIKGVHGYKYGSRHLFDDGTLLEENSCYCTGECIPAGVLNVSMCREDSPTFLSLPHFYGADPYYVNSVEGLHPVEEKHDFFMNIEPKTGIAFDVAARMQLNMLLQPIEGLSMYENVPKVFMPIFYFDQRLPVGDELASNLRMLQKLPSISNIASVIFIILGSFCLLWVLLIQLCCSNKLKYSEEVKLPHNTHEEIPLRS